MDSANDNLHADAYASECNDYLHACVYIRSCNDDLNACVCHTHMYIGECVAHVMMIYMRMYIYMCVCVFVYISHTSHAYAN
jgi:hypothetical protein